MRLLSRLKVDNNVRLWKSTREAFLTVWKKDKIDAILGRLDVVRSELTLRVVMTNKNSLDGLDETFQHSFRLISSRQDDASRVLSDLVRRNDHTDQVAGQRHLELLATIRASGLQNVIRTASPWQDLEPFTFPAVMQKHVLRSLAFSKMEDREDEITVAHKKTFEWVFCESKFQEKQWDNFPDWLRHGSGIYWVNGKAASGKSTLMRFIRKDARTHQALRDWAEPHQLLISSFYFWNNGTSMQKSLEGLLRSILHDILQSRPDLHSIIVTGTWRELVLKTTATPGLSLAEPTLVQLQKAFQNLLSHHDADFRLCLVIDGLDEYSCAELKFPDLAELFKSVSMSTNVKIVLSSRPLLVFEEAFSGGSYLKLQDFTADDIKIYVDDRLGRHPRMPSLRVESPEGAEELASVIVSKASGVFLWVQLVVNSLLEGLTNGDNIKELQKTLDTLPEALEDLFRHMFSTISSLHRKEASCIFQIVRQFQRVADRRDNNMGHHTVLTATTLSFAMEGTTALDRGTRFSPLSTTQSRERRAGLERRLKSRCCGLIEVHDKDKPSSPPSAAQGAGILLSAEVQFIHKTVTDFLDDQAIWDTIVTGSTDEFDSNIALLNSYVMQLKHANVQGADEPFGYQDPGAEPSIWTLICTATAFAKHVRNNSVLLELLHEMDRVVSFHWTNHRPSTNDHWSDSIPEDYHRPCAWHDSFLSFCIRNGLLAYVAAEFEKHGKVLIKKMGRPLLDYAVRPEPYAFNYISAMHPRTVEILLENGANPNEVFNGWTAWSNALYAWQKHGGDYDMEVLKLLLHYDADPNVLIDINVKLSRRVFVKTRYSALRVLRRKLDADYIDNSTRSNIKEVIKLLEKRGAKEQEWRDGKLVYPHTRTGFSALSDWAKSNKARSSVGLTAKTDKNVFRRMILRVQNKETKDP